MARAKIDYLKLGPSATNVQQPNDVATTFRDVKSGIAKVIRSGVSTENGPSRAGMKTALQNFHSEFSDV